MIELPLAHGKVALVDIEDARLAALKWTAIKKGRTWYAVRGTGGRGAPLEYLHRVVLGLTRGDPEVDHANGDGLDCRRANLRMATRAQNNRNKLRRRDNSSGFKGVYAVGRRWRAEIRADKQGHHLGVFTEKESAARAYDDAARRYFGAFARLNFPLPGEGAACS